ncbi:MAG: hypothetical protein A2148_06995 [Chloroflexi bacterium RBG_16_68_14]|nr:MAG: hypothetical protein A2148_06995 [Chloroflexi bacterium RBG_16_68_14]
MAPTAVSYRFLLVPLVAALAMLAAACAGSPSSGNATATPTGAPEHIEVRIRGLAIQAETARTAEERAQGLSGRDSLPEDGGMLFFLEQERVPGFTMRGMRFPLDFIWISSDLRVADLTENVPHPAAAGKELSGIGPDVAVLYALEVNAGTIQRFGIQVGDPVTFEPNVAEEGNLFANPSFEEGGGPWFSLDTPDWGKPFSVSQRQDHSGASSALLELRSDDGGDARVYGVVQEIAPQEFPDLLSGYYYVGRWEQGTPKQYLQVAVIVHGASNIPPEAAPAGNHQVRYLLAGVEGPPIEIGNARFVTVGTGEPEQGRWVRFERNVREDFQELWGAVPEGFEKLRVLFEVRWDDRQPADGPSAADVHYDDLYIGPADGGP